MPESHDKSTPWNNSDVKSPRELRTNGRTPTKLNKADLLPFHVPIACIGGVPTSGKAPAPKHVAAAPPRTCRRRRRMACRTSRNAPATRHPTAVSDYERRLSGAVIREFADLPRDRLPANTSDREMEIDRPDVCGDRQPVECCRDAPAVGALEISDLGKSQCLDDPSDVTVPGQISGIHSWTFRERAPGFGWASCSFCA